MSIPMAPSSEIFIDDILKKSLIFKEKRLDLIGRDIIMQWFVRLIRLDMEYFMLENKERHRCSEIYTTKIIDSDKITEQCKRERK